MNVFELQVRALAQSTNELLLLLTNEKAQGDYMGGWRVREAADDFSLGVFTVHKAPKRVHEHPHVRLPCFASPSASVACCLLSPPRARFYSRQAQPPAPTTQNFLCFGLNECQWSYRKAHPGITQQLCPPTRKDTQWRLPHANPLSLWTGLCASFRSKSTSHKRHSPVRVWKSLQPSGKKKYHEKNQRGELIEPAAVCSTYQTSQSSCCCTGFFLYKRWAGESWAKTRTKCLLCPSMTMLLPRRQLCLLWDLAREHFDASPAPILHFCLL